ncbi:MAG TPA: recombinase family protein [Planctomycetaceae bacterium]|jgi:site-specific DNA recombinase|nr:recombinase family protein [Planctomycetaceae bacterium]
MSSVNNQSRLPGQFPSPVQQTSKRLVVSELCLLWVLSGCIGLSVILALHFPRSKMPELLAFLPAAGSPRRYARSRGSRAGESGLGHDVGASYSRYSSDNQDSKSIVDQQRECHDRAAKEPLEIARELEFFDEAVSGTKPSRIGFDRMMEAAKQRAFSVLFIYDIGRLARESVISMPTLKTLVYVHKVRVISVTEGLDTAQEGWEVLATILCLHHERYLFYLAKNVFRGQEGTVLDGLSVGDHCFGYDSVPIEGPPKRRRGRNGRSEKKYVIIETEADWVRRIFYWFVRDHQPIQWIVRELNRLGAPKDHRHGKNTKWGRAGVIALLRREKYVGIWPWGVTKNCRNPITGQIAKELRPREECGKWLRHLPELRIVDDETFAAAQRILDQNAERIAACREESTGRLRGSSKDSATPRHLLQGRIRCAVCASAFHVGGLHAKYLICPAFRRGLCSCRTMLPRDLAERLILEEVGRRILSDKPWRRAVHEQALQAWNDFASTIPSELSSAENRLAEVEQRIARLVDKVEDGLEDPDIKARLAQRRNERQQLERNIGRLQNAASNRPRKPTPEWVDEQLKNLHEVLASDGPAAAVALGNLIGKVVVSEAMRPGRMRPFLRGEFALHPRSVVDAVNGNESQTTETASGQGDSGDRIVIDFAEPDPKYEMSDEVKQLSDTGLANWEIAEQLQVSPSRVTFLYNFWHERSGMPVPERKNRPKRKRRETPLYKRIADEAKQRWDKGDSESEIGRDFETTQATVRKSIEWWHTSRDLPVPKFADRRAGQVELAASLYQAGFTVAEIAKNKLKVTITTVRKMLDEWFASKGEIRPDGRSLRRRSA